MAHTKADTATAAALSAATAHLAAVLDSKRDEFKQLLPPELSADYSLCYWGDDGCYWCSDDGREWYRVKCIS